MKPGNVEAAERLAYAIVEPPNDEARPTLFMLHGIYGRGRNWGAIARQLLVTRARWRTVLVDLRGHGDSPSLSGPHTVDAAAADVVRLSTSVPLPMDAVLGHSFGGKVAYAIGSMAPEGLRQVWAIDATPAPKPAEGSAWQLLGVVRQHPGPYESRDAARAVIESAGFAPGVASWMVTNLAGERGAYRWRLDFDVMQALMEALHGGISGR